MLEDIASGGQPMQVPASADVAVEAEARVLETQVRKVVAENFDPTEFGEEYLTLDIGDLLVPLNEEDNARTSSNHHVEARA